MSEKYDGVLLLDEENYPIIIEEECAELKPVLKDFVNFWAKHKDQPTEVWLPKKLGEYLPEKSADEITAISNDIIASIETATKATVSLDSAVSDGRSKESWFASQVQKAVSGMSSQKAVQYLADLDAAMQNANDSLYRTISTKAGTVSQNPSLDGFIAEQYHAQTFNLNAEATGSSYRAKVLEPNGTGYAKNSVDIVIVDGSGKVVRRYQSKYCKDAKATQAAFEKGDYRGQRKLAPDGQAEDLSVKANVVIEAPDGTTSNALSKEQAKQLQDEAQSGKWNELNWNEYKTKDLTIGIGKQAGHAALQGALISVGFDIAAKLWNGEEIKGEEVVETALKGGADFGIKAAAAGALKVGVEKGIITVIPKGTPAGTIANIVYVAVEDVKVIGKIIAGEYTLKEGIDKLEQTTVAVAGGLVVMGEAALTGATIGAYAGPIGAAIGGFIGGTIGYMAGSKFGETVIKVRQKIRDKAIEAAKEVGNRVLEAGQIIGEGLREFGKSVKQGFAALLGF